MDHYIDLTMRRDPEFSLPQLMSALYAKLHRGLVRLKSDQIGVSFPGVDTAREGLGAVMRLHGDASLLQTLMATDWLSGMRDHLIIGRMAAVPEVHQHRSVRRVQAQSSPERLRRRSMKRHGLDADTARKRIPDSAQETLDLPFLRVASSSTSQTFLFFIEHGTLLPTPVPGQFNTYGLSSKATIPWF
ncbi:type I-F CRISPR-associated endoribonuclease Cas6/Csy4 [Pollutimonas bauzanensis]|uniref:CRISPR-associated protein, Csy4 family n=1 Tax=Pollutimonas bauzanensis TaxID=658167 RepID=A0A1M5Y574_9BURK|nr:type I-F CRISPR-associated endoribonuclease Cas6/Csy4 [Pollutimonas bauzanensis]SHI07211.1 CRISPR-associated protein, Csy4 family [Pollutimonas bauzanensis]